MACCRSAGEAPAESDIHDLGETPVTLEELEDALPNGFHDAEIFSFELEYVAGTAKFRMNPLVGWPDDPEPERQAYQKATLVVNGLCFCSVDPPYSTYPFLPSGKPILVTGAKPNDDAPPFVRDLVAKLPTGSWCYHFFVDDLGHSRIQTTLDLYTDEDLDEMIAAQEKWLDAVGFESGSVQ